MRILACLLILTALVLLMIYGWKATRIDDPSLSGDLSAYDVIASTVRTPGGVIALPGPGSEARQSISGEVLIATWSGKPISEWIATFGSPDGAFEIPDEHGHRRAWWCDLCRVPDPQDVRRRPVAHVILTSDSLTRIIAIDLVGGGGRILSSAGDVPVGQNQISSAP